MTVKDVATFVHYFVPRLSNLPPVALDRPCLHVSTHSTMSKSWQFFYCYQSGQNSYRINGVIFICIESIPFEQEHLSQRGPV